MEYICKPYIPEEGKVYEAFIKVIKHKFKQMNKDNLVLIGQSHGWVYKYVKELNYNFKDSYVNCGLLLRIFREIVFRCNLPGKALFYNKDVICNDKVLLVNASLITHEYIKWLHDKCHNCKIILVYTNPVNPNYSPNFFLDSWCTKWTSDKDDAIKYNMHLFEGGGYFPQWKATKVAPIYDVFYIGKDKARLERLHQIERDMNDHGVKTMFYITWNRGWQKKKDGIHKPFLPYERVLDYIGKSKAILHLLDGAQNGITLRIQESLIHKVKLITDDVNITSYDFYNSHNIFILGKDDMNNLRAFLDSPYENVESDFFRHAYYDQMIEEVVENSFKDFATSLEK